VRSLRTALFGQRLRMRLCRSITRAPPFNCLNHIKWNCVCQKYAYERKSFSGISLRRAPIWYSTQAKGGEENGGRIVFNGSASPA
jgi:hypothetical protein